MFWSGTVFPRDGGPANSSITEYSYVTGCSTVYESASGHHLPWSIGCDLDLSFLSLSESNHTLSLTEYIAHPLDHEGGYSYRSVHKHKSTRTNRVAIQQVSRAAGQSRHRGMVRTQHRIQRSVRETATQRKMDTRVAMKDTGEIGTKASPHIPYIRQPLVNHIGTISRFA